MSFRLSDRHSDWAFSPPPSHRSTFWGRVENRAIEFFFSPRLRLVGRDVPERLRRLEVPPGVRVAGTYRPRKPAFRAGGTEHSPALVVRYVHPDVQSVWPRQQVAQALGRAGFEAASASHPGFDLEPQAFYWDEQKTNILLIVAGAGKVELHLLGADEGQNGFPGRIPNLRLPAGAEATEVDLYSYRLRWPTAVSTDVVLDGLATQITGQGWQEAGRLSADWGALARFGQLQGTDHSRYVLTVTLTRSGTGDWMLSLRSAAFLPSADGSDWI